MFGVRNAKQIERQPLSDRVESKNILHRNLLEECVLDVHGRVAERSGRAGRNTSHHPRSRFRRANQLQQRIAALEFPSPDSQHIAGQAVGKAYFQMLGDPILHRQDQGARSNFRSVPRDYCSALGFDVDLPALAVVGENRVDRSDEIVRRDVHPFDGSSSHLPDIAAVIHRIHRNFGEG